MNAVWVAKSMCGTEECKMLLLQSLLLLLQVCVREYMHA